MGARQQIEGACRPRDALAAGGELHQVLDGIAVRADGLAQGSKIARGSLSQKEVSFRPDQVQAADGFRRR